MGTTWRRIETADFGPGSMEDLNTPGQQWLTVYHRNKIFQWSLPELVGEWRNFGLLWQSGVVDDPRVFFCPSERDPDVRWQTPLNPWPPSVETATQPANPNRANHTESSFERRAALTGVLWDRIPNHLTVVSDPFWRDNIKSRHLHGVNVAYRDGHAKFIRTDNVESLPALEDWSWINAQDRTRFLEMTYWLDRRSNG